MIAELLEIKLHQSSKTLELIYQEDLRFVLPCEYLRVFSPSAEVRGHSQQAKLVKGKQHVTITAIEPVGNYAVKFIFDDGHKTGLYTFEYLYHLAVNYKDNWQSYLERVGKM